MTSPTERARAALAQELRDMATMFDAGGNGYKTLHAAADALDPPAPYALLKGNVGEPAAAQGAQQRYAEFVRIADEVIAACNLPRGCHGTLIGALGEAYQLGTSAASGRMLDASEGERHDPSVVRRRFSEGK